MQFDEELMRVVERAGADPFTPIRYGERILTALCAHLRITPEALTALAAIEAVVVPVVATEEMARVSALRVDCGGHPTGAVTMWGVNAWRAMLAASPYAPPTPPQGGGDA